MQKRLLNALLVASVIFIASCGSSMNSTLQTTSTGSAPLSLTMGDTPPAGVTVLSFEIKVTAASMNSSGRSVSLLPRGPVEVEVENLQVEKAFLGSRSVPAGTYTSLDVTFANPQMTIMNDSGAAIGSCANGAVCRLEPPLNPSMVSYSNAPFPLTVMDGQPVGLQLDFNLNQSIQSDLSVTPVISFKQLQRHRDEGENEDEMEGIDDVSGKITAVDSAHNTITLADNHSGQTFTITVNNNTAFRGFMEEGMANAFSSLAVGQVVEVDLILTPDGTFVARNVTLKVRDDQQEGELGGKVVAVDSPTEFKVVVLERSGEDGIAFGSVVTVTIADGATFRIDADGINLPSSVMFQSSADLVVGQRVQLDVPPASTGTSVTTTSVTLHRSQVTANVAGVSDPNFTLNNLPGIFGAANPPITQIDVQTSSQTQFENVTGVSGLASGDKVSARGLLFRTAGNPLMIADHVTKRLAGD
ncbi:MAG: DUF5666 domain-containing protein [Deltaproteobacteria bacterium]